MIRSKEKSNLLQPELLSALDETLVVTEALICAYRLKLELGPQPGPRPRRWQLRTLSALRAALKAKTNTESSIRKIRRRLAQESRNASG